MRLSIRCHKLKNTLCDEMIKYDFRSRIGMEMKEGLHNARMIWVRIKVD